MGNNTEFEASFRRKMGNNTNSRRVFGEKRETIRYKIHHFYTKKREKQGKNWKNRGKNTKKLEKNRKKNTKKTGKNRKKIENYKKYRNKFLTRFREMLKTETSSETSSGTSSETSSETSSRSSQMSRNNDSRAKTIHRPTPRATTRTKPGFQDFQGIVMKLVTLSRKIIFILEVLILCSDWFRTVHKNS